MKFRLNIFNLKITVAPKPAVQPSIHQPILFPHGLTPINYDSDHTID